MSCESVVGGREEMREEMLEGGREKVGGKQEEGEKGKESQEGREGIGRKERRK